MTKAQIRDKYKNLRSQLASEEKENRSLEIANKLLELPIWEASFYHVFLSMTHLGEINSDLILSILSGKDKHIVVSKSNLKEKSLRHYLLTDSTKIVLNSWGIPEPEDGIEIIPTKIDVVFVPLLAYDKYGNRVGYGQGYYDQFLSQCRPETIKIGLSFFEAETHIEDLHENDVPLNYCVTPNKLYTF